jgi:hypothetical protein
MMVLMPVICRNTASATPMTMTWRIAGARDLAETGPTCGQFAHLGDLSVDAGLVPGEHQDRRALR